MTLETRRCGHLAYTHTGERLPLRVLRSAAGFYLGTADESGPVSRESAEYFPSAEDAQRALDAGPDAWTQRDEP